MKKNKTILITGATQGLGLATAKHLAKKGYTVYGSFRKTSKLDQLDLAITECLGNLSKIELDVTDEKSISRAINTIISEKGKIDVLINNACEVVVGTMETCTIEEQKREMDVNYFGPVRMLQSVLPYMRDQNKGHIINISSGCVPSFVPFIETYSASKHALEGLSNSLAVYLSRWNIKVTLIEPGAIKTDVAYNSPKGSRMIKETKCFSNYCEKVHQMMKDGYDSYQPPEEIANLIEKIVEEENPHYRYFTESIYKEHAEQYFKEATGDTILQNAKRNFLEKFDKFFSQKNKK